MHIPRVSLLRVGTPPLLGHQPGQGLDGTQIPMDTQTYHALQLLVIAAIHRMTRGPDGGQLRNCQELLGQVHGGGPRSDRGRRRSGVTGGSQAGVAGLRLLYVEPCLGLRRMLQAHVS